MLIGYARTSTQVQKLDLQLDNLKAAGCDKIFVDKISGVKFDREGLSGALAFARPGDTVIVWKLDRLGRSLKQLIQIVTELQEKGIEFKSLNESIDTSSPGGKLIFHVFAALSEFERELIRERTFAGLEAARLRGRCGGRPKVLSDEKIKILKELSNNQKRSIASICESIGISRSSYYRAIKTS